MKTWQSIVVTGDTLGELERRCNENGQSGYEPVGFMISKDGEFYAALLKRETPASQATLSQKEGGQKACEDPPDCKLHWGILPKP